ncbi:MAG: T9SS type A sorting domain-containing protein [Gemmatimonadetes bacterium]|nr:T9SS type A sorting domain-containing protein [Gemmatimonadota bacterium]
MRFHHALSPLFILLVLLAVCAAILMIPTKAFAVIDNADSLVVGIAESYTTHGDLSYNAIVRIEGTLYVTQYNGSAGTGELTLRAPEIIVDGTINGTGRGFRGEGNNQEGPGIGGYPGGGGGYGGAGGNSGFTSGGPAYGSASTREVQKGSGGGDGGGGQYGGGNGGAAISLIGSSITITTNGVVQAHGTNGTHPTSESGGGSGGGILIQGLYVNMNGGLSAIGGNGTSDPFFSGGGGAGGRIKVFSCSMNWSGVYTVAGGAPGGTGGTAGGTGTFSSQNFWQPVITSVTDITNDQGRQVRLSWDRACRDDSGATGAVTHYTIWRRIDDPAKRVAKRAANPSTQKTQMRLAYPPGDWDFIADVPARGEDYYNVVAPTLADSSAAGMHMSTFFVSGVTDDPFVYYDSDPDSGYSVDNLAPAEPAPFTARVIDAQTHLEWGECPDADFHEFHLHAGIDEFFIPGPGNLLTSQGGTQYVDASTGGFYKVAAVDWSGNISSYALVTPGETVDVDTSPVRPFLLSATSPVRNRITIRFSLPDDGPARCEVFDITGRVATSSSIAGHLGAGTQTMQIDTSRNLASGVYFVRLTQGENTKVVRSVMVR